jgi:hypothetical protein
MQLMNQWWSIYSLHEAAWNAILKGFTSSSNEYFHGSTHDSNYGHNCHADHHHRHHVHFSNNTFDELSSSRYAWPQQELDDIDLKSTLSSLEASLPKRIDMVRRRGSGSHSHSGIPHQPALPPMKSPTSPMRSNFSDTAEENENRKYSPSPNDVNASPFTFESGNPALAFQSAKNKEIIAPAAIDPLFPAQRLDCRTSEGKESALPDSKQKYVKEYSKEGMMYSPVESTEIDPLVNDLRDPQNAQSLTTTTKGRISISSGVISRE